MEDAKKQLVDKLKTANNVLVTVSRNPSVDQLAALLGLTLLLNKDGKHAAAIFSGEVPSTLEFLQPEDTFEKNTDSLRDFIIALDKNKADKLRYKVEDNVVRIFITPYKTSISQEDFEFSQGDFNVDLIVALGVSEQADFDEAIVSHGRILHDATLASITTVQDGSLGTINWHVPTASSLSEMVTELASGIGHDLLDQQISTALLTGIVAETDRFSNEKTTQQTMSMSALLMGSGANSQLVASKLAEPVSIPASDDNNLDGGNDEGNSDKQNDSDGDESDKPDDGSIEIDHDAAEADHPEDESKTPDQPLELPTPDEDHSLLDADMGTPIPPEITPTVSSGSKFMTEPPMSGGTLTASSDDSDTDQMMDPLSMPATDPPQLLQHTDDLKPLPTEPPTQTPQPEPPTPTEAPIAQPPTSDPFNLNPTDASVPSSDPTLAQLEHSIDSPHEDHEGHEGAEPPKALDAARDEVDKALSGATDNTPPAPIQALNSQPFGGDLHPPTPPPTTPAPPTDDQATPQVTDPNAPPPVPPPIPFNFGSPPPAT